jgi:putative transposase
MGNFSDGGKEGSLSRFIMLLRRELRTLIGRDPEPSAGIVDSQSRLQKRGLGYDGGKKIKGRKRHSLVDT